MFLLETTKNDLIVKKKELLTSGSVNIYPVKFTFSHDWDGLIRTAVFRTDSTSVSVVLGSENLCDIPWEVLVSPRRLLYVGVYGTKDDAVIMPTIWGYIGEVKEGTTLGENAKEPTPTVYQQLITQLDEGRTAAEEAANRAEDAAIHQPYPNAATGTWFVWDAEAGAYKDTGEAYGGSGGGTISVKDDGAGNVEITAVPSGWTVTDDGNGNVVIGG